MNRPQLVLIAGPNGAGKSTFYDAHLADSPLPYLNADLVAARTGIDSLEAARLLDAWRNDLVEARRGFITETVFSDPVGAKLDLLRKAVAADFEVTLIYIGLEPQLAGLRIDQRIAAGGHDVPRDRVGPRFERSLRNLVAALELVPVVLVYDNSSIEEPHRLIARFESGRRAFLVDGAIPPWARVIVSR
jgi:predicted ABC-type ATPase